jgi:hypothetical protein
MAHQMADEIFYTANEPAHGDSFKKACRLLRANPDASTNYRTLDEIIFKDSENTEDKRLVRIKKLMALAKSQNLHEAEAAMKKAQELIGKYNVDIYSKRESRNFMSIFLGKPALRHASDVYHLAHLLSDFYFVEGIWIPAFVLEKNKMGRVLEITGTIANIKIASYVHDFVNRFINSKWEEYNNYKNLNNNRKTDFAIGIIEGFSKKLKSFDGKMINKAYTKSLLKTQDPLLKKHMAYKYPHIVRSSGRSLKRDISVLNDGLAIGKTLVISKGITSKEKEVKYIE